MLALDKMMLMDAMSVVRRTVVLVQEWQREVPGWLPGNLRRGGAPGEEQTDPTGR